MTHLHWKLVLGVGALILPAVEATATERVLLKARKLVRVDKPPLEPGHLLIVDGKIADVGSSLEAGVGTRVRDFGSAVLIPGLVNPYTQAGVRGGASEFTREVTPSFDVKSAVDWDARVFREQSASGVTTIGIAPGTENVIAGKVIAMKTMGLIPDRLLNPNCGLVMTLAEDASRRNRSRRRPDSIYIRQPTNRMGVVWLLRSTLQPGSHADPTNNQIADALGATRRVFSVSRRRFDIETALRLADELSLSPTIVGGEEAHRLASELSRRKMSVLLGPLSTTTGRGVEATEPAWNRAGILHTAGVEIALSGPELLEQARFAVRFGLAPNAALRAITATPAKMLAVDDRVGALRTGLDADLVVLSGEPLEFTSRILATIVDGVTYHERSAP